ncbi:RNA polymerase sigma factor [Ruminococcus sp.]|uniref:RNA polymerase sigma factor n=1 Tax=Ruminococcus sp. TaxID=41978 RepID=UPI00386F727B
MTKEVFAELVLKNEDILFKIAMSMLKNEADAQDAMQSAILKAFERLGTLKHEEYFRTWLVRILINICNKQLRQRNRTIVWNGSGATSVSSEVEVEVRTAVEALPMKIRQVIIMYYSEQFTTKEISAILCIPKGTVLSRLHKGRKLLRLDLDEQ